MRPPRPSTRDGGRRVGGVLASCALLVCLSAGCTTARSSLGTSDSSCYLALPTANRAVRPAGRLVGVHLLTTAGLRREAPTLVERLSLPATLPGGQRICIFEFAGSFTAASVAKPHGDVSGHLAVVIVEAPTNELLGTVILHRPPLRFTHTHVG